MSLNRTNSGLRHAFATGALALLSGAALMAADAPKPARIKIDADRVIGTVDPRVFGNFVEHLGRCVYGGVFEPGSPLADENGYRKDVMEAAKRLGVAQIRWPGGNFVSPATTGRTASGRKRSARCGATTRGAQSSRTNSAPTSSCNTASGSAPSRTSASTPASAPSTKPATGSSIATSPITLTTPTCAAPTAATSHGTSRSGASATRLTGPGNWATATPKITPSSRSKRPKPCAAPTIPSS